MILVIVYLRLDNPQIRYYSTNSGNTYIYINTLFLGVGVWGVVVIWIC